MQEGSRVSSNFTTVFKTTCEPYVQLQNQKKIQVIPHGYEQILEVDLDSTVENRV